jgi:uncharacterized protein YbaP (TraB family)
MTMKYLPELILALLFIPVSSQSQPVQEQCRPFNISIADFTGPEKFKSGLLWEISRNGQTAGHIFGTIHVDDERILNVPEVVRNALYSSDYFAMEVVPSAQDAKDLSMSMFFMDGNRLDLLISPQLFDKTTKILEQHSLAGDIVALMQPWAAYIIMSYPADMGTILDLHLLEIARMNGSQVTSLETSSEQIDIFSGMDLDDQVRILADTVCHYETMLMDFDELKRLYLNRDLQGLYIQAQKYTFDNDEVYEEISARLISQRNERMTQRIVDLLDIGNAFIAVGAMHLPGEDGILNQLETEGYLLLRRY